ncbi:MAG: nicotinate (nicotinamide) nucleotide adenylyltransferase [Candidatus Eremiobacteraeota bacterium]|nr:nicotinate (nicotinamide) nucleotide adenylyltransferase [Candidatus Eremiobacteraeota bacterium]
MRLGLFGGTFDPVHNAHLFVAESARVLLELERVVFLPAKGGQYRDGAPLAPAAERVAMVRAAIASNPAFALDETDLQPEATGRTADLIPALRRRYPGAHLTFIVGADSLVRAPWQRFDDVLDGLDAFAIAPRGGESLAKLTALRNGLRADRADKLRVLELPALMESATLVRERLARGETVRYIVPEVVWRYIEERGWYRDDR